MTQPLFWNAAYNRFYAQAPELRRQLIETSIKPYIQQGFEAYPAFRSAALLVGQYWCDEADDAVHAWVVFSEQAQPDLEACFAAEEAGQPDRVNWPSQPRTPKAWYQQPQLEQRETLWKWDDNGTAIPAFAAWCREGAYQDASAREKYTPYAIFARNGEYQVVAQPCRPWLEGIDPIDTADDSPSLTVALEIWNGECWEWLGDGMELCWEIVFRPSRVLVALLLGLPGPPPLHPRPGLPPDLSPEARRLLGGSGSSQPACCHTSWTTLQELMIYPDWQAEVILPREVHRYAFAEWLKAGPTAEPGDELAGRFVEQPDPDWPWLDEAGMRSAPARSLLRLPWPQARQMLQAGTLRQDLNYLSRVFERYSLAAHSRALREQIFPRLQDLCGDQPQNLRWLFQST